MKERCDNEDKDSYEDYGGRGIRYCEEWWDFTAFLRDMGERPPGTTLDRIDFDGDYTPENCRWATADEQSRNRRGIKVYTYKGETRTLAEWSRITEKSYGVLYKRVTYMGYSIKDAIESTIEPRKSRKYTHNGKTQSISEWAKEAGISTRRLYDRLVNKRIPIERALRRGNIRWK